MTADLGWGCFPRLFQWLFLILFQPTLIGGWTVS